MNGKTIKTLLSPLALAILFVFTFLPLATFASEQVAKVIILKGLVKAKFPNGSVVDVKVDQDIPEGTTIQTAEKSFVKLTFIDKSQMNLGPNSQMVITAFPKKEAGIITLVKGQIRSKVTKDYMEMDDKSKSKLYIKTKTAAMGIRGTDFQVNYNPENQNTSLITFEGKVAMGHIDRDQIEERFDQARLEAVVSSEKAVLVTRGEISAVNLNVSQRAMEPTKLGSKQIEALEKNESGLDENPSEPSKSDVKPDEASKQFRNPIPPGASGTQFSNTPADIEKKVLNMPAEAHSTRTQSPDGFFNVTTGEYKLPAGSVIDLKTVNIVPPPTNSYFDKISGTFIIPETIGKIDKSSGAYKAPMGLELSAGGKFIVVDQDAFVKSQMPTKTPDNNNGRSPASVGPNNLSNPMTNIKPPELFGGAAETFIKANGQTYGKPELPPPPGSNQRNDLGNIANNVIQDNNLNRDNVINTGTNNTATRTKIIFNAD